MNVCIVIVCCFICGALSLHPHWRLAWYDEFNGNAVDTTKWNIRNKIGNLGNGELQWYHPSQVSVSGGYLRLNASRQSYLGQSYLSGLVDSQDKSYFTYGRYEFRTQMAPGKGMWPAIWMLSQTKCWAKGAEYDIAEFRGSYPKSIGTFYHYSSKCCTKFSNCISSKGSGHDVGIDLTKAFHTYALEWHPTNMTWFIDDVAIESYQTTSLTVTQDNSPHYWMINSAVGGSYPGNPDSSTVFPNFQLVDYVRVYVLRASCSGTNVCSGNGCCSGTSFLCNCNPGWAGASCEFWVGSAVFDFNAITSLDNVVNGWGNEFALYITANTAVTSGNLKLTLSNGGCPLNCGDLDYASGGWESWSKYTYGTFTFVARGPSVAGTGLSLVAAGSSLQLEQIAFGLLGSNKYAVELRTWTTNWGYHHTTITLGFDASAAFHNYTFTYAPTNIKFYIDGVLSYTAEEVIPTGTLGLGAFYTAQPDWYGPFTYSGPSSVYISKATWQMAPQSPATC